MKTNKPTKQEAHTKNWQDQYTKNLNKLNDKPLPEKVEWHTPTIVDKQNGSKTYRYKTLVIVEKNQGLDMERHPISHNELLTILDHYDLTNSIKRLIIHNYPLRNMQGYTKQSVTDPTIKEEVTLWIPSQQLIQHEGHTKRYLALWVFLHELSHALGNAGQSKDYPLKKVEDEADDFATREIKKWKKILPRLED